MKTLVFHYIDAHSGKSIYEDLMAADGHTRKLSGNSDDLRKASHTTLIKQCMDYNRPHRYHVWYAVWY